MDFPFFVQDFEKTRCEIFTNSFVGIPSASLSCFSFNPSVLSFNLYIQNFCTECGQPLLPFFLKFVFSKLKNRKEIMFR